MSTERKCSKKPELWGGIECTYNRVKDVWMDQLLYAGHYARIEEDIERIAGVGVSALRYPIIWERHRRSPGKDINWSTTDRALLAMRRNGITPVVGLVHHGSGPRGADLLSASFAPGLAAFARMVAERYPWIEYYTPVNEPLTTARFSGLYGLWFPHRRDDNAFVTILINEMLAIVLAMREIRKVSANAKLIQTEDLAKVYSTPRLQYQANFENQRRWLTWDFLFGKVDRHHVLWDFLLDSGGTESSLQFLAEHNCPPHFIGVDYYVTSERYLDEGLDRYPAHTHGANHFERYADVEAVRVRHGHPSGIRVLMRECWERYGIPMVVTEAHISSDTDNQIRWFSDIRRACCDLMGEGADIRAVTAWALLGAYGWNTLLTNVWGGYEPGVFDVRSGIPKPTPLAAYLKRLARDAGYRHPAEAEEGWWHREERFVFEVAEVTGVR